MSSNTVTLTPASGMSNQKYAVWAGLTSFFLMWTFLYVVLVVFRPGWVCCAAREGCEGVVVVDRDNRYGPDVDRTRAFVVALIITLIVMLIVWLVAATAGSR